MLKLNEEEEHKGKAVGLLSGGLDSTIAVKLMLNHGLCVSVINFISPFCTCTSKGCQHEASRVAKEFDIPIKIIAVGQEYIDMIKNPVHGYGRNMNPCIDCRIFMLKKAKKYMEEINADFIFTGEILDQRPMSQRKNTLALIEQKAGLEGLIVRPLSAKHFKPTIPEKNGLINRDKLLSFQGRRRRPLMDLAENLGIYDYPCPAGGCRLTDTQFSKRLTDSFNHDEGDILDVKLLKYGRHFRLNSGAKVVVGRNEIENKKLQMLFSKKLMLIEVTNFGSPIVLLKNQKNVKDIKEAIDFCIRYSDANDSNEIIIRIEYKNNSYIIKNNDLYELYQKSKFLLENNGSCS